jgi:hypothetical protein
MDWQNQIACVCALALVSAFLSSQFYVSYVFFVPSYSLCSARTQEDLYTRHE